MLDALKSLFENNIVSEEIAKDIQEAFSAKVHENRMSVTAELREEFAQKYEHDKSQMVEAIDAMLSEKLTEEVAEFQEDRKQLAEAKAKYAIAMRENTELVKGFVVEQLETEIKELRADKIKMQKSMAMLEEFVVEALSKEIGEFQEDKKDLAETKVRLVREGKEHIEKVKANFIKKTSSLVAETVSKKLESEIKNLKEDIDVARQNDFGRKLFEAFASEYSHSYLNEKSETAKLLKVVDLKDKQLAEAKHEAESAKALVETKEAEKRTLVESTTRKEKVNELIAPLTKDQKDIMQDLLESVQTAKLQSAFDKYLPSVVAGKSPSKQKAPLTEGKEITGNRENTNVSRQADENVVDIRRLAGLS